MKKLNLLFIMVACTFLLTTNVFAQKNVKTVIKGDGKFTDSRGQQFVNLNGVEPPTTDQVSIDILTGLSTSGNSRAPQGSQRYIRTCYVISAAEMSAAGFPSNVDINLLGFLYSTAQSLATTGNFKIYLENTSDVQYAKASNVWATIITPMTLVHDNPVTIPAAVGNWDIPFVNGTPFTYTGGGLYIAFEYQNAAGTLSSANVAYCNTAITPNGLKNAFSTTALPTSVGATASAFRPDTRLGSSIVDVVQVVQTYTLGKVPTPFGVPFNFSTLVKNVDASPLTFDVVTTVKDSATGTVRYTNTTNVIALASGSSQEIFYTDWVPAFAENDSIIVTINAQPGETYTANNTSRKITRINPNSYSYSQGNTADGGVGFNAPNTGDFVARFHTNSSNSINQVDVNFFTGGQPFQVGIWSADGAGGIPGTNIFTSASQTSAAGVTTVLLDPPVAVSGDFFVGVKQTVAVNVSFAYQTEAPIRDSTFYFVIPTGGTAWTDFAPANSFRFMIEPKFALNNDVAATAINQSGTTYFVTGTTNIPMTGTVTNFGLATNSFDVNRKILDASNNVIYNNTVSISNLAANGVAVTTFPDFTGFSSGTAYTIKDSTLLATDQNSANNKITRAFTPIIAKTACLLYTDLAGRDSLTAQLNGAGYTGMFDVIDAATFTNSFRAWRSVFYLLISDATWAPVIRDSLKAYLDNSTPGNKKSLAIFGNDLGYQNDPIRNVAATAADTIFYRQYLRAQYVADSWISAVPTAGGKIYGAPGSPFSAISGDSVGDPYPDMVKAATWYGGAAAFLPMTTTTGDSAAAIYYIGANYNLFYGTNVYANYRTKAATLDSPVDIFNVITEFINNNGGLVPVELASFTANSVRNEVTLNWRTVSELNNSGFEIERAVNGTTNWSKVGFVSGNGTTNSEMSYTFRDAGLSKGTYGYRLKQIDYNGNYKYYQLSGLVSVGVPNKFELAQNYPNPFNPATKISYDIPFDSKVAIKIFDVTGKEVASLVNQIQVAGYYTVQFNASYLSSGVYFYQINADGGNQNFVKTLKMMLIK